MFCNIMNGLTNFYSSNPVCICDEIDEDEYDEMYDNTYVTDEELNEIKRKYNGDNANLYGCIDNDHFCLREILCHGCNAEKLHDGVRGGNS